MKTVILPLEVGKTYQTKFSTRECFTIERIDKNHLDVVTTIWGYYELVPDLKMCPLNPERLIPEKIELNED
jgi:hypothetical protein